jgi:hypothetical protein
LTKWYNSKQGSWCYPEPHRILWLSGKSSIWGINWAIVTRVPGWNTALGIKQNIVRLCSGHQSEIDGITIGWFVFEEEVRNQHGNEAAAATFTMIIFFLSDFLRIFGHLAKGAVCTCAKARLVACWRMKLKMMNLTMFRAKRVLIGAVRKCFESCSTSSHNAGLRAVLYEDISRDLDCWREGQSQGYVPTNSIIGCFWPLRDIVAILRHLYMLSLDIWEKFRGSNILKSNAYYSSIHTGAILPRGVKILGKSQAQLRGEKWAITLKEIGIELKFNDSQRAKQQIHKNTWRRYRNRTDAQAHDIHPTRHFRATAWAAQHTTRCCIELAR